MEDSKQQSKRSDYQLQRAERLKSNPGFKTDIINSRTEVGSHSKDDRHKILHKVVIELLAKYQLPPSWYDFVEKYILDTSNTKGVPERIALAVLREKKTNLPQVHIIIDGNATLEDVKQRWRDIKELQGKLPYKENKRRRGTVFQDRDKQAFILKQGGLRINEISEQLKVDGYGDFDYSQIKDFIRNYQNRLNN